MSAAHLEYRVSISRDRWHKDEGWRVALQFKSSKPHPHWVDADWAGWAATRIGARFKARRMLRRARAGRLEMFKIT